MIPRILLAINNLDTAGMKHVLASVVRLIDRKQFTPIVLVNQKTGSALESELGRIAPVEDGNLRSEGLMHSLIGSGSRVRQLKKIGSLIHDFDYASDWNGAWLARRAGIPYIAEKTNLSIDSYRWRFKLGLASHIVCLSTAQQRQLARYAGNVSVIPTGVNISFFATAEPASRNSMGLDPADVVLVSVAHLVPVKGYEDLIPAIAELRDVFPRLRVIAVGIGDEAYVQQLKNLIHTYKIKDRFLFAGQQDQVAPLLRMADGCILATRNTGRREAFGAALVEAMAAGLPVISTRSGGPEDIVVDGVTGFLAEGTGSQALVSAICRFMDNRSHWKEMGHAGHLRASDLYREEKMVQAYERVYTRVLESRRIGNT